MVPKRPLFNRLLTDWVRVADDEKQVYGTQFRVVGSKLEPYPIEDEANLDQRRKEVGLPPLAKFRKLIEALYKPKAKERGEKRPNHALGGDGQTPLR